MPKQTYKLILTQYLVICEKLIIQKEGWDVISNWSNADYIRLCTAISRETRIYISAATLKRIFGKVRTEKFYIPQKATLDALAIFVGYVDWGDFEEKNKSALNTGPLALPFVRTNPILEKRIKSKAAIWLLCFFVLLISVLSFTFLKWNRVSDPEKVRLICINPEGVNFLAARFKLLFPEGYKDTSSFVVDFNDKHSKILPNAWDETLHYYDTPGYYKPVLRWKGKPIDTTQVYVKSDGWFAYAVEHYGSNKKQRLRKLDGQLENVKPFYHTELSKAGIDTLKFYFVNLLNIKKTNISGDNFELRARVRTFGQVDRGICSQVNFQIYGTHSQHYTGIISRECTEWADAVFSEQVKQGPKDNLASLGINLSTKGDEVVLNVSQQKVRLYANNKLIYTTTYRKPIGKVLGVRVLFQGQGEVQSFYLKDLKTGEFF
uniref:hypothetical protein n=1 Tax=Pedobacter schmidteae TaxID=2201271 RepID=UPI000EB194DA|nr:hypothetical protein [Pedobacter schmidteae]